MTGLYRTAAGESCAAAEAATTTLHTFADGENVSEDFEMLWAPVVELQLASNELDTAEALLRLADPLLGGRGRPLTHGIVRLLRGRLSLARGQDPGADLQEAEGALEAYGAPYLLARTRLELGRWLHEQGRIDEALPLLALARPVFEELRAVPSLAELDALAPSWVLTGL